MNFDNLNSPQDDGNKKGVKNVKQNSYTNKYDHYPLGFEHVKSDKEGNPYIDYMEIARAGYDPMTIQWLSKSSAEFTKDGKDVPIVLSEGSKERFFADMSGMYALNEYPEGSETREKLIQQIENQYLELEGGFIDLMNREYFNDTKGLMEYALGAQKSVFNVPIAARGLNNEPSVSPAAISDMQIKRHENSTPEIEAFRAGVFFDKTDNEWKDVSEYYGDWGHWFSGGIPKIGMITYQGLLAIPRGFVNLTNTIGDKIDSWMGVEENPLSKNPLADYRVEDDKFAMWMFGRPKSLELVYGDDGIPFLASNYTDQIKDSRQIISLMGPQQYDGKSFISGAGAGAYDFITSALEIPLSMEQWMNSVSNVVDGNRLNPATGIGDGVNTGMNLIASSRSKLPIYNMENTWSWGSTGNFTGSLLANTLAMIGPGALGAGSRGSLMLLTGIGLASYTEEAKNSGVSSQHIAWGLPAFAGLLYVTEQLGGKVLHNSIQNTLLKKNTHKVIGSMVEKQLPMIGRSANKSSNKVFSELRNSWYGYSNIHALNVLSTAIGEGVIEEPLQGAIENTLKAFNDYIVYKEIAPNSTSVVYADGMFNEYNVNHNYWSQHLWDGWAENITMGALGGILGYAGQMGLARLKKLPMHAPTVADYVDRGDVDLLYQYNEYARQNNLYAPANIDINGNAIEQGSDQVSRNDFYADLAKDQLDMFVAIHERFNTGKKGQMLTGGSPLVMANTIQHVAALEDMNKELRELQVTPEEERTPEQVAKISELEKEIQAKNEELKDWLEPDSEANNVRSRGYNLLLREAVQMYGSIESKANELYKARYGKQDIVKKNKQSPEYAQAWMEASNFVHPFSAKASYGLVQTFEKRAQELRDILNKHENFEAIKGYAEVYNASNILNSIVKDLADGKITSDNVTEALGAIAHLFNRINQSNVSISSIEAFEDRGGKIDGVENVLQSFQEAYKGIVEAVPQLSKAMSSQETGFLKDDNTPITYGEMLEDELYDLAGDQMTQYMSFVEGSIGSLIGMTNNIEKLLKENSDIMSDDMQKAIGMQTKESSDSKKELPSDDILHYYAEAYSALEEIENAIRDEFKNIITTAVNEKGEQIEVPFTPQDANRVLGEILGETGLMNGASRVGAYDLSVGKWLKDNPKDRASYDHPLTESQYDRIFKGDEVKELRERLESARREVNNLIGVDDDVIISSVHARNRLANLRLMFEGYWNSDTGSQTELLDNFKNKFKSEHLSKLNEILDKAKSLVTYEKVEGNMSYNKYDLNPNQVRDLQQLKTDEQREITIELIKKLNDIESFMHEHRDIFFSKEEVRKHIHNYYTSTLFAGYEREVTARGIVEHIKSNRVSLGYLRARFMIEVSSNNHKSITSNDLAIKSVTTNMSGQMDVGVDESTQQKIHKENETIAISNEVLRAFKYKSFVNHMASIYGSNISKQFQEYESQVRNSIDNEGNIYFTFEQFDMNNFNNSMSNGGLNFFNTFIEYENDILIDLATATLKTAGLKVDNNNIIYGKAKMSNDHFIPNTWLVTGDFSTGKSTIAIVNQLKYRFANEISKGASFGVTIVTNTDNLRKEVIKTIKSDPSLKNIRIQALSTRQVLNNNTKIDNSFVIWDEASLISDKLVTPSYKGQKIKDILHGKETMMLGDYSQMADLSTHSSPSIFRAVPITKPLNRRFSAKYVILSDVSDAFRSRISVNNSKGGPLPPAIMKINELGTVGSEDNKVTKKEAIGVRYANSNRDGINSIVNSFLNDNYEGRSILIVESRSEFKSNSAFKELRDKNGKIKQEYRDKIFVIVEDISEEIEEGDPISVQGLRAENVYIAIDHSKLNHSSSAINRMMYTATGRANKFLMLADDANNITKDESKLEFRAPEMHNNASAMYHYLAAINSNVDNSEVQHNKGKKIPVAKRQYDRTEELLTNLKNKKTSSVNAILDDGTHVELFLNDDGRIVYMDGELGLDEIEVSDESAESFISRYIAQEGTKDQQNKTIVVEDDIRRRKQEELYKSDPDIEIGKVGNTEYEVKADGVYYQGKKLDNPENLSTKELITEDIRRRWQEDLDKPKRYANYDATGDPDKVNYYFFRENGNLMVGVSKSATNGTFSGMHDTAQYIAKKVKEIEEQKGKEAAINYIKEVLKAKEQARVDYVNGQYDIELAALEAHITTQQEQKVQQSAQKEVEETAEKIKQEVISSERIKDKTSEDTKKKLKQITDKITEDGTVVIKTDNQIINITKQGRFFNVLLNGELTSYGLAEFSNFILKTLNIDEVLNSMFEKDNASMSLKTILNERDGSTVFNYYHSDTEIKAGDILKDGSVINFIFKDNVDGIVIFGLMKGDVETLGTIDDVLKIGFNDELSSNEIRSNEKTVTFNSLAKTELRQQGVNNPVYVYPSRISTILEAKNHPRLQEIENISIALRQAFLRGEYKKRRFNPKLVFKTNYKMTDRTYSYALVIESGYSREYFKANINQILDSLSVDNEDFNNSLKELRNDPIAVEVFINSLFELGTLETFDLRNDIKNTVKLYDSSGKKITKTEIANIIQNAEFEEGDAALSIYTSILEAIYDKLPSELTEGYSQYLGVELEYSSGWLSNKHSFVSGNEYIPLNTFLDNIEKRGFVLEEDKIFFNRDANNQVTSPVIKIRSAYGTTTNIFVKHNLVSDTDYENMTNEIDDLINRMITAPEGQKAITNMSEYYTAFNRLHFIQMIKENKKRALDDANNNNGQLGVVMRMFVFNQNKLNLVRETTLDVNDVLRVEKEALKELSRLLKQQNHKNPGFGIIDKYYFPVSSWSLEGAKVSDQKNNYNVNIENINVPGFYVNIKQEKSISNHDLFSLFGSPKEVGPDFHEKSNVSNDEVRRVHIEEFNGYWERVLGANYQDLMTFTNKGSLIYNGVQLFGAYYNGRLYYEVDENGKIEWTTPRHEVEHFVYDKILSNTAKNTIRSATIQAMMNMSQYSNRAEDSFTEKEISEWRARQYGRWVAKPSSTKIGQLLNRFFAFVRRVSLMLNNRTLYEYYKNIENGEFSEQFASLSRSSDVEFNGEVVFDEGIVHTHEKETKDNSGELSKSERRDKTRKFILKAFNNNIGYYSSEKAGILSDVLSNTFLGNGTMSIKESIKAISDNAKDKTKVYSRAEFEINGVMKKMSGRGANVITFEDAASLFGKDIGTMKMKLYESNEDKIGKEYTIPIYDKNEISFTSIWSNYVISSNMDYMLSEALNGIYNVKDGRISHKTYNNWDVKSNEVKSEKFYDAIFKMWLGSIRELGSNGNKGNIIGYGHMSRMINDLGANANEILATDNSVNTFEEAFKKALNERINQSVLSDRAGRHARALSVALSNLSRTYENRTLSNDVRNEALGLYNRIFSILKSTNRQNLIKVRYVDGEFKVFKLFPSNAEEYKYTAVRNVIEETFGSEGGLKKHIVDMFQSKNAMYTVTSDGITFNGYGEPIKMFTYENGVAKFTDELLSNIDLLYKLTDALGIELPYEVKRAFFPDKTLNKEAITKDVKKIMQKYANGSFDPQNLFATQLFAMITAVDQWAKLRNELDNINSKIYKDNVSMRSLEESDIETYNKVLKERSKASTDVLERFKKGMIGYDSRSKNNAYTIVKNALESMFIDPSKMDRLQEAITISDEDNSFDVSVEYGGEHYEFFKPSDFYNFFTMLGAIVQNNNTTETKARAYNDNGKAYPMFTLDSRLTRMFNNGENNSHNTLKKHFDNITKKFVFEANNILIRHGEDAARKFIEDSDVNYGDNITVDIIDGQIALTIHNPIFDSGIDNNFSKRSIVPENIEEVISTKDVGVAEEMHSADVVKITFDNFVTSIISRAKRAGMQEKGFNLPIVNISDRLNYYNVSFGSDNLFFDIKKGNNGYEYHIQKENVIKEFYKNLKYFEFKHLQSIRRWGRVLAEFKGEEFKGVKDSNKVLSNVKSFIDNYENLSNSDKKFVKELIGKYLYNTSDYFLKGDVITLGKAALFNDSMYNKDILINMNEMIHDVINNKNINSHFTKLQSLLHGHFVDLTKIFASTGYNFNEFKYKDSNYEGNSYYKTVDGKVIYNNAAYSLFLADMLSIPMLNNILMGGSFEFKNGAELSKRLRTITTGVTTPTINPNNEQGKFGMLREQFHVLIVEDIYKELKLSESEKALLVEVTDGQGFGGFIAESYFRQSFGGLTANYGRGVKKPLIINQDYLTGRTTQVKFSQHDNSKQLLERHRKFRDVEKILVDMWSHVANKELALVGAEEVDLWEVFERAYNETRDYDKALEQLRDYIEDHKYGHIIESNLVAMAIPTSNLKGSFSNVNPIDIYNLGKFNIDKKSSYLTINSNDYGIVTNLSMNPLEGLRNGSAMANQFISIISQLDTKGANYSDKIKSAVSMLEASGMMKLRSLYDNMKRSDNPKYSREDINDMHDFLRAVSLESAEALDAVGILSEYVNNKNLDLNNPAIQEELQRIFRSYINKTVIRPRIQGGGFTVSDGSMIEYYKFKGTDRIINLNKLEGLYNVKVTDNMIKDGVLSFESNGKLVEFDVVGLDIMKLDNGKVVGQTVAIANPLINEYKMKIDEDIDDVYDVLGQNLKGNENRVNIVKDMIIDMVDGKSNKSVLKRINNNNTDNLDIIFRVLANDINFLNSVLNNPEIKVTDRSKIEGDLEKAIKKYFDDFEKVINGLSFTRKPTGHHGQVAIGSIIGFINDVDNTVYKDMRSAEISDEDADGDQTYIHLYNIEKFESESDKLWQQGNNKLLDVTIASYKNVSNFDKINRSSSVEYIEDMIVNYNNIQEVNPFLGGIASQLKAYDAAKTGKNATGIAATAVTAYGELLSLPINFLKQFSNNPIVNSILTKDSNSEFAYNKGRNIGDWLQVILNNGATHSLGGLNVPDVAVPLLMSALMGYEGTATTVEELNADIIKFFNKENVRRVLKEASNKGRISEYSSFVDIYKIIDEKYENARLRVIDQGGNQVITTKMYENSLDKFNKATEKLEIMMNEFKEHLKKNKMEFVWAIAKKGISVPLIQYMSSIDDIIESAVEFKGKQRREFITDRVNQLELSDVVPMKSETIATFIDVFDSKMGALLESVNKYLNTLGLFNEEIRKHNDVIIRYEQYTDMLRLRNFARSGQAIRNLAIIIDLKNGIETKTTELVTQRENIENALKQSLEDFFEYYMPNIENGIVETHDEYLERAEDYFRKHDQSIRKMKTIKEVEMAIRRSRDISNMLDISKTLATDEFERYRSYLKVLYNPYGVVNENVSRVFTKESPFFDHVLNRIKAILNVGRLTAEQKYVFESTKNEMIIDLYFKELGTVVDISPRITLEDNNGEVSIEGPKYQVLSSIDLITLRERKEYVRHFIEWFKQMQNLSNTKTIKFAEQSERNRELAEMIEAFRTNQFLSRYTTIARRGKYLAFDSTQSMTDEEKLELRRQFNNLPSKLKEMLFNYEIINNGMSYKKGSALDAIPPTMYNQFSEKASKIYDIINDYESNGKLETMVNVFIEHYMKNKKGLGYMNAKSTLVELMNRELVEAKAGPKGIYPGDGFNKHGVQLRGTRAIQVGKYTNNSLLVLNPATKVVSKVHALHFNGVDTNSDIKGTVNTPVVRVLTATDLAEMEDNAIKNKSWSKVVIFNSEANYRPDIYYIAENGRHITMSKVNKNNSYMWKVELVNGARVEVGVTNTINSNFIEDLNSSLLQQQNIEQMFPGNSIPAYYFNVNSKNSLDNLINEASENGTKEVVLGYFTGTEGSINGYIASLLHGGEIDISRRIQTNKIGLYTVRGAENVNRRVKGTTDNDVYSFPIATRLQKSGLTEYGSTKEFKDKSSGLTLEDITSNLKSFFEDAAKNPRSNYVLLLDNSSIIEYMPKNLEGSTVDNKLSKMSRHELNTLLLNLFKEYGFSSNIKMTLDNARDINNLHIDRTDILIRSIENINNSEDNIYNEPNKC